MEIFLNGRPVLHNGAPDIASFLKDHGYAARIVAVAVNGGFVPKAAHARTLLKKGDEIEIVAPMQGG